MGGERETVLAASPEPGTKESGTLAGEQGKIYRWHENRGEVHLHDDADKLKCAIPVAQWSRMWQRLETQFVTEQWIDPVHNTIAILSTNLTNDQKIDIWVNIKKIEGFGANYLALRKFTRNKS